MAPAMNLVGAGFSGGGSGLNSRRLGGAVSQWRQRRAVVVRTEAINPEIRKAGEKVVDTVVVTELPKPLTAYCSYSQWHYRPFMGACIYLGDCRHCQYRDGWVRAILLAEYSTKLVKGDGERTSNFSWKQEYNDEISSFRR